MPGESSILNVQIAQKDFRILEGTGLALCRESWYNEEKEGWNMRDIPMFSTEFGIASLVLGEIPYRQEAYVTVRTVLDGKLDELLAECVTFCRMAGAEKIYAKGEGLEEYPLHTAVWQMRGDAVVDKGKLESLFPVTEATASRWREIYNRRMANVDNAVTLQKKDEESLTRGAYFVHKNGELLGIGWLDDTKLLAMAATQPGTGEQVMHTLMSLVEGAAVTLEVASTNTRALRLYEKLGFLKTAELARWYKIG